MDDKKQIEEMAKEPQINEIAKVIFERGVALDGIDFAYGLIGSDHFDRIARAIYNAGYRKIPEGAVVVSKSVLKEELQNLEIQARKETAREIIDKVKQKCKELENKYSHLCKSKRECLEETCRYEGVLAVKRELYEIAKQYGVEVE